MSNKGIQFQEIVRCRTHLSLCWGEKSDALTASVREMLLSPCYIRLTPSTPGRTISLMSLCGYFSRTATSFTCRWPHDSKF